jgi:hypothetical protein
MPFCEETLPSTRATESDDASSRIRTLQEQVATLVRVQEANRDRAMRLGAAYEAVPHLLLDVVRALLATPRLSKSQLAERLVEEGVPEADARGAIESAQRLGLIREGPDRRCWLARSTKNGL